MSKYVSQKLPEIVVPSKATIYRTVVKITAMGSVVGKDTTHKIHTNQKKLKY
jgi:hypothetical protein